MITQLTMLGESWAVVIDEPLMSLLKIDPETELEIATDGHVLTVSPIRDKSRQKKREAALAKTNHNYGHALKKLAE